MTQTMGPMGALHRRHGSEIHTSNGDTSLTPFKHVWASGWHFWDLSLALTVPMEGLARLRLPTHPLHLPLPLPPTHPL